MLAREGATLKSTCRAHPEPLRPWEGYRGAEPPMAGWMQGRRGASFRQPSLGCCWGPLGTRHKPGASTRPWQDHSRTFQPGTAPSTLKQPMPAAGKMQLGFSSLWPHPSSTSCPQPLLGPHQPQPFRGAAWGMGMAGLPVGKRIWPLPPSAGGLSRRQGAPGAAARSHPAARTSARMGVLGCLPLPRDPPHPSASPAAQTGQQKGDVLHGAWMCSGEGGEDAAPGEQGRHWAEGAGTQFLSAGDGEGGSQPLPRLCGELVGKGENPQHLRREPHAQGSPSGSAAKGTRRRSGGLWPGHGTWVRRSHSQLPPAPGGSSLAVFGVGVGQCGGRLGAGLDRLHPLLQAAAGEHHVAGADALRPGLPQVLLAVPDAVTEVDEQACGGDRESSRWSRARRLARTQPASQHTAPGRAQTCCLQVEKDPAAC